MKLSAKKIAEAEAWVEEHGLYPQKFGAKIQDFCDAIGITDRCYRNWKEISEFSEAISRAREIFRVNHVRKVENALLKAAIGFDFVKEKQEFKAQVIREYDPKTGKKIKEINVATSFDNFMNAEEAINFGLCDSIIEKIKM